MSRCVCRMCGSCLSRYDVVTCHMKLPQEQHILIQGGVYTKDGRPMINAGIAVYKVDLDSGEEVYEAITFTEKDGSYGISVPRGNNYRIVCYPS